MAYAEKRGKHWRVRYKRPDGDWHSESAFETKESALNWGRDQETDIRRNEWRDPRGGEISLKDWIDKWRPAQDLEPRTEDRYDYLINAHLLPEFGDRTLSSFTSPEEIAAWERKITTRRKRNSAGRYAQRTAQDARSLLSTILGDAAVRGLIAANVAARRRGRGRKSRRSAQRRRTPRRIWASALQVLLIAERAAVLSGQDDDFVLIVTKGWTGVRWGEVIGLERPWFRLSTLEVDWQLSELGGRFTKTQPKDDSIRPVDLPPFLADLLSRHVQARPDGRCRCPRNDCGGAGQYLFLGPDRGHYRRSAYNRRVWHPAVDGAYPAQNGKAPRTARPVLVDASPLADLPPAAAQHPGRLLLPPWPCAIPGQNWAPPRGRGRTRFDLDESTALASWLPVKPGLVPHGLRHSHETWMIEDGIPEVLRHDRLGHQMQGIQATYSHVSQSMRERLKQALQRRWETALDERITMCPRSPVATLDELLTSRRLRRGDTISQISPIKGETLSP
jgi:integrase